MFSDNILCHPARRIAVMRDLTAIKISRGTYAIGPASAAFSLVRDDSVYGRKTNTFRCFS